MTDGSHEKEQQHHSGSAAGEQIPALDEVANMNAAADEDCRWMVLFEEDYHDFMFDADDNVALLIDNNQALEILRLASQIVGHLATEDAPDEEPVERMIAELKKVNDAE